MVMYSFVHHGRPKAKERPRAGRNSKKLYTPKGTLDAEAQLAAMYDGPMVEGPLGLYLTFSPERTAVTIFEMPSATPCSLRGDIDNYTKLVLDALEGVAYENDRQIVALSAWKAA